MTQHLTENSLPYGGADSHAHLDLKFKAHEVEQVIERARKAGVSHIGQVFLGPDACKASIERLSVFPQLFFMMGIHPHEATELTPSVLEAMRQLFIADTRLKAVGEIGFDFFRNNSPAKEQEQAFRNQLHLALEMNLPVVIHSRSAAEQSVQMLEAEGFVGRPVLWHCFNDADAMGQQERIVANGWHISIPGPVTYPANAALREAIGRIPVGLLMVETDCPYLSPQGFRGSRNEPALVAHTARTVADCLGMDAATFWLQAGDNCRRFFKLESV